MELYTSTHAETVEDIFDWPWRRFERFYEAFIKRQVIETLEIRKNQMIAALYSNSNWDDDKGTRKSAIEELEANFEEAVSIIHHGQDELEDDVEISEDNPFFASTRKAMDKIITSTGDISSDSTVKEVIDYAENIDQ